MKSTRAMIWLAIALGFCMVLPGACKNVTSGSPIDNSGFVKISELDLTDIIPAPVMFETPASTYVGDQYVLGIDWEDSEGVSLTGNFEPATEYTAIASISARTGYTLNGLKANSFTHQGAKPNGVTFDSTDPANDTITLIFPETAPPPDPVAVTDFDLTGKFAPPQNRAFPVRAFSAAQYSGDIVWYYDGSATPIAADEILTTGKATKAVVTITEGRYFYLHDVAGDFTYNGSTGISTAADDDARVVTVTFAALPEPALVINWMYNQSTVYGQEYRLWSFYDDGSYTSYNFITKSIAEEGSYTFSDPDYKLIAYKIDYQAATNNNNDWQTKKTENPVPVPYTMEIQTSGANTGKLQFAAWWAPGNIKYLDIPVVTDLDLTNKITKPLRGMVPVTSYTLSDQYDLAVSWKDSAGNTLDGNFEPSTEYTATVQITLKDYWVLVDTIQFTHSGAKPGGITFIPATKTVTIEFPATDAPKEPDPIDDFDLAGKFAAPSNRTLPASTFSAVQYDGKIDWYHNDTGNPFAADDIFSAGETFKAVVTLSAGYDRTFDGVTGNFTCSGSTNISTATVGDTRVVTITFGALPTPAGVSWWKYEQAANGGYAAENRSWIFYDDGTYASYNYMPGAYSTTAEEGTYTFANPVYSLTANKIDYQSATNNNGTWSTIKGNNPVPVTYTMTIQTSGDNTGKLEFAAWWNTANKKYLVIPYIDDLDLTSKIPMPVRGAAPVTADTSSREYDLAISWKDSTGNALAGNFAPMTAYTATVQITTKIYWILQDTTQFTHAAAASVSAVAGNTITIQFPATGGYDVSELDLTGIIPMPMKGDTPVTSYTGEQYDLAITWKDSGGYALVGNFAAETAYTASVLVTAKSYYSLTETTQFTHSGAIAVNFDLSSGIVTIGFKATAAGDHITDLDLTDKIPLPVSGAIPLPAYSGAQYSLAISWEDYDGPASAFADSTLYTATAVVTANTGYVLDFLNADSFTYNSNRVSVSYETSTETITLVFDNLLTTIPGAANAYDFSKSFFQPNFKGNVDRTAVIDNNYFTGTVEWYYAGTRANPVKNSVMPTEKITGDTFESTEKVVKALIKLEAKRGYTFTGINTNMFQYAPVGGGTAPYYNILGAPYGLYRPDGNGVNYMLTITYGPLGEFYYITGSPATTQRTYIFHDDGTFYYNQLAAAGPPAQQGTGNYTVAVNETSRVVTFTFTNIVVDNGAYTVDQTGGLYTAELSPTNVSTNTGAFRRMSNPNQYHQRTPIDPSTLQ